MNGCRTADLLSSVFSAVPELVQTAAIGPGLDPVGPGLIRWPVLL